MPDVSRQISVHRRRRKLEKGRPELSVLFLWLLFLVLPETSVTGQEIRPYGLLEYSFSRVNRTENGTEAEYMRSLQIYEAGISGSLLRPDFCKFFLGSSFYQTQTNTPLLDSPSNEFGYYDLSATFFSSRTLSFDLFAQRKERRSDLLTAYGSNVWTDMYGFNWRLTHSRWPLARVSLNRSSISNHSVDRSDKNLLVNLSKQFENSRVGFDYRYNVLTDHILKKESFNREIELTGESRLGEHSTVRTQHVYQERNRYASFRSNVRVNTKVNRHDDMIVQYFYTSVDGLYYQNFSHRTRADFRKRLTETLYLTNSLGYEQNRYRSDTAESRAHTADVTGGIDYLDRKEWTKSSLRIGATLQMGLRDSDLLGSGAVTDTKLALEFRKDLGKDLQLLNGYEFRSAVEKLNGTYTDSFHRYTLGLLKTFTRQLRLSQKIHLQQKDGPTYWRGLYLDSEVRIQQWRTLSIFSGYKLDARISPVARRYTSWILRASWNPARTLRVTSTANWTSSSVNSADGRWIETRIEYQFRKIIFTLDHRLKTLGTMDDSTVFFKVNRTFGDGRFLR